MSCLITPSLVCLSLCQDSFLSASTSLLASVHLFLQLAVVLILHSIFSSCFHSIFMIHAALCPFCPCLLYDHHPTFTLALNCTTPRVRALSEQHSRSLPMCLTHLQGAEVRDQNRTFQCFQNQKHLQTRTKRRKHTEQTELRGNPIRYPETETNYCSLIGQINCVCVCVCTQVHDGIGRPQTSSHFVCVQCVAHSVFVME